MLRRFLSRLARDENGATAIEYGMILALMFLVILGALQAFGATGSGVFNGAMDKLRAAMGG
ncbi:MAG: Flp family type IVb pilin [Brevundimonas sp.]|uniref:Flp family type IVb pilin n=1 Tax=Brevundimonas sp. TaxID=1871086 RepID=UPI00248753A7|nr:Flp family type IVb pilin [Brevundimonas sp.]MDI1327102.1 Flp family type IVb pilin [Brevundimonas sp.]